MINVAVLAVKLRLVWVYYPIVGIYTETAEKPGESQTWPGGSAVLSGVWRNTPLRQDLHKNDGGSHRLRAIEERPRRPNGLSAGSRKRMSRPTGGKPTE
jgi:hypothetical protein